MKITINTRIIIILLSLVFSASFARAQAPSDSASETLSPVLRLHYLVSPGDSLTLKGEIFVRKETGSFSLQNALIKFIATDGDKTVDLGTAKAGENGFAVLGLRPDHKIPVDKEGKTTYKAVFAATDKYGEASADVTYKLAKLTISLTEEDSVKNIHVKGVQIEPGGVEKVLTGEKVSIYVPRMLSNLKIGEVELDVNGEGSIGYPEGIIGDTLGKHEIFAMIEESENFGYVKAVANVSWGIPKHYFTAERPSRELWTPVAPVWMIITLIIMLTGVWGHYFYAVIQLIMIKRHNKKKNDNAM